MKILVHSRFHPNIGDIETVASLLAHEWSRMGESVVIASDVHCTAGPRQEFPFSVHYRPGFTQWLRLMLWADVFVHLNISLKALWPTLMVRRPFIAVKHAYYCSDRSGYRDWRERLKLRVTTWATNIAVSQAVDRLGSVYARITKFKVRASRILSFEGSGRKTKILHFAQDRLEPFFP
jgi:glycogen synthase